MTYYNENDPKAVAWLGELIKEGLIPDGHIDSRSITDVCPDELAGFEQCHFFAGIGGWAYAARLAGWGGPVWTMSCPCQPFSGAGRGKAESDERHLWPIARNLIEQRRPPVVFGEQVASPLGRKWLSGVRADLEALGYAVGAADLCAASVGAPHKRQRLYWAGYASSPGLEKRISDTPVQQQAVGPFPGKASICRGDTSDRLGYPQGINRGLPVQQWAQVPKPIGPGQGGFWGNWDTVTDINGKVRRIEPGTFPLAHGVPGRMGLLRGYGNAIVPQVAAEFMRAAQ